jgi:hypothetical protein
MILTEKQIKYGVWYYGLYNNFPPESITEIEDYRPTREWDSAHKIIN